MASLSSDDWHPDGIYVIERPRGALDTTRWKYVVKTMSSLTSPCCQGTEALRTPCLTIALSYGIACLFRSIERNGPGPLVRRVLSALVQRGRAPGLPLASSSPSSSVPGTTNRVRFV